MTEEEILTWVQKQKDMSKNAMDKQKHINDLNTYEYYRGRWTAMLDMLAFIMTEGKLN